MMYSNEELLKLWSNSAKRKDFVEKYKDWGVFIEVPELRMTYYKFELPDGAVVFVMEHMQEVYDPDARAMKWDTGKKYYLQKDEFFEPRPVGVSSIDEHLMSLKQSLLQNKGGGSGA